MAEDPTPDDASALRITEGVDEAPSINPRLQPTRRPLPLSVEAYVAGIRAGDRVVLSRAITLIESTLPDHRRRAREIVEHCLPSPDGTIRLGITGVPGVGKSTFIEALGTRLTAAGHRLAVLTIDPSSARTRGSILGDKTRMPRLAADPRAFIRPSPSAGATGGVARMTRETMLLCEAAGYDVVFVETVGVGQSEVAVHAMVDFFLLLVLTGAGDELQGIKRGIIEMADAVVVTKADGANRQPALEARGIYRNAFSLFPPKESGWRPRVLACSAETGDGLGDVWETVAAFQTAATESGHWRLRRREQALQWMRQAIEHELRDRFFAHPLIKAALPGIERQVLDGEVSSYAAAQQLLKLYLEE